MARKPSNTLRTKLMKPKRSFEMIEQSAMIYKIDCMHFQANHVWETGKKLGTGLHEYQCAINPSLLSLMSG